MFFDDMPTRPAGLHDLCGGQKREGACAAGALLKQLVLDALAEDAK
jgi:hypothetical protein